MTTDKSDHPHEIIIVKHARGDDHDGHHGGVWKIAFADFMTALMCFFLVMWLINAANEETKVSVASYFNPIKLVDRNSSRRGLDDAGSGPQKEQGSDSDEESDKSTKSEGPSASGTGDERSARAGDSTDSASDEHLFSDPYAVLAEIAAESGELQNLSAKGDGGSDTAGAATGASGGESYRDPFAPDFWSKQVEQDDPGEPDLFETPQVETATDGADPRASIRHQEFEDDPFAPTVEKKPDENPDAGAQNETAGAAADEGDKTEDAKAEAEQPDAAALAEAKAISEELAEAFGTGEKIYDGISVTPTERGVMVSLTDQLDYGMYEIGSAVPRRDLVLAMEKVAAVLSTHKGAIAINGHTDGRPFRSKDYDNWRLSTARAHSAYYMLVRGGLDERRIREVTGYADRQLKVPDDPFDDRNRRIEIVLETKG
ncbi:MotB family protein [Nitratireductor sp. StC3]|uniref:MotB family protein n=1 Tax=Nitratireductor sp. StC3 TaxID=2126741 RepID=UPI000D0CAA78|nr:MotB family protein [Nitratireductor sp. StC3]PSM18976.1 flagellar motor protein MotB [Nitratireductor sp. StC3]